MSYKSWKEFLESEREKPYYRDGLKPFVESEYSAHTVYPPHKNILRALELTPLSKVKVVILGQDPYHEPGQANGLAFSVSEGVPFPPSLTNIFKEIDREYRCGIPASGSLESWARQGVLLLNTSLTVREHEANSHAGHGWEEFTDEVIRAAACSYDTPKVFMLWGRAAQTKAETVLKKCSAGRILVLKTSHPSPLSVYRGFDGCGHFRAANDFLVRNGAEPVQWFSAQEEGDGAC